MRFLEKKKHKKKVLGISRKDIVRDESTWIDGREGNSSAGWRWRRSGILLPCAVHVQPSGTTVASVLMWRSGANWCVRKL